LNEKAILFIPSNENHCKIFQSIGSHLKEYKQIFLTQGSYKNEGAEEALAKLGISFTRIDDYEKIEAEFILKKENIGIVIVGNDSDVIPQWFVNVGQKLRIPSVFVQDGMMVDIKTLGRNLIKSAKDKLMQTSPKLKLLAIQLGRKQQYEKTSYGLGGCTQIHAWGEQSVSYYVNKGVNRARIVITGIPKIYDASITPSGNQEKIILYTPTDFVRMNIVKPDYARKLAHNVCSAVTSIQNVRLIIKPHPREDLNLYGELPAKFGSRVQISNDDVTKLIPSSNLVISDLSTTGLEAIGLKKPVVIYLPDVESFTAPDIFPNDVIAKNLALYAKDEKSLLEQITTILEGKWSMNSENLGVVEKYLGPLDNKSTLRSSTNIEKLLER
jgi:hypothetical protein